MKPFNKTVSTRMVRCCLNVVGTQKVVQLPKQGRLELGSSISRYGGGDTEVSYPVLQEGFSHSFRSNVDNGNGYGPAGETIDAR